MRQREELVNTLLQKKVELEARIVELEAQLAAANAESLNTDMVIVDLKDQIAGAKAEIARLRSGGCAREQGATQYCAEAQRLADVSEEAKELLLQAHEPDQGQLRTQWDKDVDEWIKKTAHSGEANQ